MKADRVSRLGVFLSGMQLRAHSSALLKTKVKMLEKPPCRDYRDRIEPFLNLHLALIEPSSTFLKPFYRFFNKAFIRLTYKNTKL